MMDMSQIVLTVAGAIILLLIALVGWFAQKSYERFERKSEKDREDWQAALAEDRKLYTDQLTATSKMFLDVYTRERDAREASQTTINAEFARYRERVAQEHPNFEAVERMMKPIASGLTRIEEALNRVFVVLERKVDK
jgi:FtsZ-interacting cell division protein ZipA